MHHHAKKISRTSRGQHGVSMQDGHDGRILSIEFFFIVVSGALAIGSGEVKSRYL